MQPRTVEQSVILAHFPGDHLCLPAGTATGKAGPGMQGVAGAKMPTHEKEVHEKEVHRAEHLQVKLAPATESWVRQQG